MSCQRFDFLGNVWTFYFHVFNIELSHVVHSRLLFHLTQVEIDSM